MPVTITIRAGKAAYHHRERAAASYVERQIHPPYEGRGRHSDYHWSRPVPLEPVDAPLFVPCPRITPTISTRATHTFMNRREVMINLAHTIRLPCCQIRHIQTPWVVPHVCYLLSLCIRVADTRTAGIPVDVHSRAS